MNYLKGAIVVVLISAVIAVLYISSIKPPEEIVAEVSNSGQVETPEPYIWDGEYTFGQVTAPEDATIYATGDINITSESPSGIAIGKYTFTHDMVGEMSVEDLHRLADLITILSAAYVGEETASDMVETMFIGYE